MENSKFNENLKVDSKNLIPLDAKSRCLWVMKATSKAYSIGSTMSEKGDREATQYINYNYTINQFLGELEYRLRKGDISKEEFKSKCEEIYEKYGINFDTLRENLSLFEQSDIYHKQIKEFIDNNYYKLNYDENGNRTEKTELDIKSEALDTKISNRLKTQFQEYCKQKQNDEKTKEEHIQETNGRQ